LPFLAGRKLAHRLESKEPPSWGRGGLGRVVAKRGGEAFRDASNYMVLIRFPANTIQTNRGLNRDLEGLGRSSFEVWPGENPDLADSLLDVFCQIFQGVPVGRGALWAPPRAGQSPTGGKLAPLGAEGELIFDHPHLKAKAADLPDKAGAILLRQSLALGGLRRWLNGGAPKVTMSLKANRKR
jgi:hypothetical protein